MGYRVELEEIDAHLRAVSGTELVGSVAWPIDDNGMACGIVGFVIGEQTGHDRLIAAMKTRLPNYMVPNRIVALKTMPMNSSGKVDRNSLRQMLAGAEV